MNYYYKGFLRSKSDYLFLDSDDFFKKNQICNE